LRIERAMKAFNAGAWDEAKALCAALLEQNDQDPEALLVLGHICAASGERETAAALLAQAQLRAPADPPFLASLGAAYNLAECEVEARNAFEAALRIDPMFARALCGLGNIHFRIGDWASARRLFERALTAKPNFAPALAELAQLAFRENRDEEARDFAEKAAAIAPNSPAVQLVLAEIALSDERFEDALAKADHVVAAREANPQQRGLAMHLKARIFEGLGRFDEAFAWFEFSNDNMRNAADRMNATNGPLSCERLERIIDFIQTQDPSSWPKPTPNALPDPVFLVGFPRSGTTLAGQVLGAHPDVDAMEENDSFQDSIPALLAEDRLSAWGQLTTAEVDGLRDAYWARVAQRFGRLPSKRVVVDKMPMNIILLPVIRLLFPRSKVLFVVRDPRDVVISCFKQRFDLNLATVHFLSLATTVAYFDVVMRLGEAAQRHLDLKTHELRYERLVRDFDAALAEALSFICVQWSDAVRGYAESARSTRIRTPSARAVTQPISSSASGAWTKYAGRLAPHMPMLCLWAQRLGYHEGGAFS
jgi:tetratricopeptide (TPR) repeat protein